MFVRYLSGLFQAVHQTVLGCSVEFGERLVCEVSIILAACVISRVCGENVKIAFLKSAHREFQEHARTVSVGQRAFDGARTLKFWAATPRARSRSIGRRARAVGGVVGRAEVVVPLP